MVHLSFHYKTTNLITFKNLCPLKKHILQQERYSTQNCFPNHVIRILYHYSARSKHISQECKCTSLLIDCVLILNKEKTSLKLKKLQNNFIPVKMGTGCYYGPSKSRIPNCLWHVTRLNNNSLPNKKKKKKPPRIIDQMDEDDLEDFWRYYYARPKQVFQGLTCDRWWWWCWWWW